MREKSFINLTDYIDKGLTSLLGRERGEQMLAKIEGRIGKLSSQEDSFQQIVVIIPKTILTINKSYFLGLFEDRVIELRKEKFNSKYIFETSEHIQRKVKKHINAGLLEAGAEEILNG